MDSQWTAERDAEVIRILFNDSRKIGDIIMFMKNLS